GSPTVVLHDRGAAYPGGGQFRGSVSWLTDARGRPRYAPGCSVIPAGPPRSRRPAAAVRRGPWGRPRGTIPCTCGPSPGTCPTRIHVGVLAGLPPGGGARDLTPGPAGRRRVGGPPAGMAVRGLPRPGGPVSPAPRGTRGREPA